MNKITCYQRLVQAIVNNAKYGEDFEYEFESFPGFARRGHSEREFRDWVKCIKWVLDVLQTHDGSLNAKKEFCRQSVSSAGLYAVPRYRLREEELQIIASAERFGRGDGGEILKYGNKNVVSYDYRHIPRREGGRKDVLVVFSGAPESAVKAAEALYCYIRMHKALPDGVMFLGLQDNQNMTEFCPQFKLRKNSEYRMYLRQMLLLGVPKGLLGKLLMTPKDTSTAENIELVKETLAHYGVREDVNLICVTYPLYQMRVATEFSFGLQDVANGVAHLFREHGKTRFALPNLGSYPAEYKALAPLFLAYSYPNVMAELCGTDETVSAVLKVIRALMLDAYDEGASGKAWDAQQLENTLNMGYKLAAEGLVSPEILVKGRYMEEDKFLKAVVDYQSRVKQ